MICNVYSTYQNRRDVEHVGLVGVDVGAVALLIQVHNQGQTKIRLVQLV